MKWLLAVLGAACVIGLALLVRAVRGGGDGEPEPRARPAPTAPAPVDVPDQYAPVITSRQGAPAPLADDPEDVEAPTEEETGPGSAELSAAAAIADRIEDEDAPANLRRIAMECEQGGKKLEGTMYLTLTLDSGNGKVSVRDLTIKDSSLTDPEQQRCVRARLESASWTQSDAPDRTWRIGVALALPE